MNNGCWDREVCPTCAGTGDAFGPPLGPEHGDREGLTPHLLCPDCGGSGVRPESKGTKG